MIRHNSFWSKPCMCIIRFQAIILLFIYRIASIILSRFILDLRRDQNVHSISVSGSPTLEFAQRVEDGLGGSLNSIWGSGINEDWDNGEGPKNL